ncbi:MAG: glycosyltransferase [Lachnospiraceae bacterium]|nr:glycosyltransferase [Lachnospiraceae bacterium]
MSGKISVIVPVYNVEKYLEQCVDSILCQTYDNLELILVDDGSKDGSGQICDCYAERDSRIRVIHQENKGISAARNVGLDVATGEYIAFVDSDDFIKPEMYEVMIGAIAENDADIVLCNYCKVTEEGEPEIDCKYVKNETASGLEALEWLEREHNWSYVVVWTRVYKKRVFQELRFKEKCIHEDEFIAHQVYLQCDKVTGVEESFYCYRRNATSVTSVKGVKYLDGVEAMYERFLIYQSLKLNKLLPGVLRSAKGEMDAMAHIRCDSEADKKRVEEVIAMFRYMVRQLKWNADKKSLLIALFPRMYYKLKGKLKR